MFNLDLSDRRVTPPDEAPPENHKDDTKPVRTKPPVPRFILDDRSLDGVVTVDRKRRGKRGW
ncbi:MAG TPA: hypothetical protein ENH55_10515 [Aurantimonas coralicida]|uniref:Uncharacterized protein n=1 Tax=marine sediment metagenome TaxID=412755 RepID=A0A0F9W9U4_9ZZZZ|nr:hypothetical protein [Aurantimonas coralicida]